ncbi:methyltransferase domain-containing protein [Candidatus Omnitrophota bacterium]
MEILFYRLNKVKDSLIDLTLFATHYRQIKKLCRQFMLPPLDNHSNSKLSCQICQSSETRMLIKLPIGYPQRQNHTLLYYDYSNSGLNTVLKSRNILDRTAGFFLGVIWNFCTRCKNASLAMEFSDQHLKEYYSQYYARLAKSSQRRKNVKELFARYIDSYLKGPADILEIGAAEGYGADYLAKQGHRVWVDEACAQFRKFLSKKKYLHLVDDLNNLPSGSFDCIYLHHVLEHIPDPAEYLKGLSRLLKPNGRLFIQVPDLSMQLAFYVLSLKRSIYARLYSNNFEPDQNNFAVFSKPGSYRWLDALSNDHLSAFTPEGLDYLIQVAGLKSEIICQTNAARLQFNSRRFSWPVDFENGNTPNGLTAVARKR